MEFRGTLYRALNPIYAREPMSGRGAELYGGRFNRKGTPALYTSLSIVTALREANQAGSLQPTTLVSYDAEFARIFDARDDIGLRAEGMDPADLADPSWRDQMRAAGEARTQAFARRLAGAGYHGLLVRSFAPGATRDDMNLVLWSWSDAASSRLTLIDDEGRLSRSPGADRPIDMESRLRDGAAGRISAQAAMAPGSSIPSMSFDNAASTSASCRCFSASSSP